MKRIIKKNLILSMTVASIISTMMLVACGNVADTEQNNENTDVIESSVDAEETIAEEAAEQTTEDVSFGLQNFEGFYCMTATEQIEDYEVTYTNGYLFNGDGTGVCFGQDVIDITWNETEIHFPDNTETFTMEPGKLTVGDITYNKIDGNFIAPNPCDVDTDNIANGIYCAYIDKSGVSEANETTSIKTEIYTEDSYDIVDIHNMAVGDVIYINGQLLPITSIEQTEWGIININGGIEELGSALVADDESNCFVYAGMDMERSHTLQGVTTLVVSANVKFIDNSDPSETKEYTGSDAVSALKDMLEKYPLTSNDCKITVEEGEIVEINRMYRP